MSKLETPMNRAFWQMVGGVLCDEYPLVRRAPNTGPRLIDGLLVIGEPTRKAQSSEYLDLTGRDVILVQSKANRLGMYLAERGDTVLEPLAAKYGIEVFLVPLKKRPLPSGKQRRP